MRPKSASSLRLWAIATSGQLAAQMPQARQLSASITASLPSSLTSSGRGADPGRSTSVMAPKGHIVEQVSQPTHWAASTCEAAVPRRPAEVRNCLLYTSDAADDLLCVDLGGRRIIKKKKKKENN